MVNKLAITIIIGASIIFIGCNEKTSYALYSHDYLSLTLIQINKDGSFIYSKPDPPMKFCNIGTWEKIGNDTLLVKDFERCSNIYHTDTSMKTLVLRLEDTIQRIRISHYLDFEAIKNYIINDKDTLKYFLQSDSLVIYPKKVHTILTNEPKTYYFDTTQTYKIEIAQIKTKRPVYRFDVLENEKIFIITKGGIKTKEKNREIFLKKIPNRKFEEVVFRDYIIIGK